MAIIHLVVKGDHKTAQDETAKRGIYMSTLKTERGETHGTVSDLAMARVRTWFLETLYRGQPYPDGSLLYYSNPTEK